MVKRKHKQTNINSNWHNWTFDQLFEELIVLEEVKEIPNVAEDIENLLAIMLANYPKDCKQIGIQQVAS